MRYVFPLLAILAGCVQPELAPVTGAAPALPEERYDEAQRAGASVYRIDPAESVVLIHVTRAGRMKHLGHDHVVASEDVSGFVQLTDDLAGSSADLQLPLRGLIVDKAAYREQFGLDGEVSDGSIEDTYRNMQASVLHSADFPYAEITAEYASGDFDNPLLNVSIRLHGHTASYPVAVELRREANRLLVTGELQIKHEDFGMRPFTAAGGLLSVGEQIGMRFSIVAIANPGADAGPRAGSGLIWCRIGDSNT